LNIIPSIKQIVVDLLHGRMRIDTKLIIWVLSWVAQKIGKVKNDDLLFFLISNKYPASSRGLMRRLKAPTAYTWAAAIGAPGKTLALEVQQWANPESGLLWWLPAHMTVREEQLTWSYMQEIAVGLHFYCSYKAWLRVLLHDAQRVPPEHAFHATVRKWAEAAMLVYHVLVKTGTRWLVRSSFCPFFLSLALSGEKTPVSARCVPHMLKRRNTCLQFGLLVASEDGTRMPPEVSIPMSAP